MTTPLTFPLVAQGSVDKWDIPLKADLIALRNRADMGPVVLSWDAIARAWDSIPPGLPTGTAVTWDSLEDATATPPPRALVGDRWFKRDV